MKLWTLIVLGILSAFTVLGNGGVIFLITARRRIHSTANCFVLSLSVADFASGVFYLPLEKLHHYYFIDSHGTSVCILVIRVLAAASITNLCAMTLDRYIAIVHPLRYVTFMRPRRVGLLISAAWLMALIRPALYVLGTVSEAADGASVHLDIVLYEIIPGITLILTTVHILLIVRRHSKQTAAIQAQIRHNYPLKTPHDTTESRSKISPTQTKEAMSAKVVLAVVFVFIVYLGIKASVQVTEPRAGSILLNLLHFFFLINSAVNPFAYAFFKTDIRREIRSCFCCSKENQ